MKIYVGHVREGNYQKELYDPLRNSSLNDRAEIILPHEDSDESFNSREELETVDYMVAEVSHPSTGLGIEMGWASLQGVPIIAIYKRGSKLSNSVKSIAETVIEYTSGDDMVKKLSTYLKA